MTITQTILQALAAAPAPMTAAQLCKQLSKDGDVVARVLGKLKAAKRVSYRKPDSGWGSYYLTGDQAAAFLAASASASRPASPLEKLVTSPEVARRLRFLIDLSERPVFQGHAILAEIIDDYRRALKRTVDREDR